MKKINKEKLLRNLMVLVLTVILHIGLWGYPFEIVAIIVCWIAADLIIPQLEEPKKKS